MAKRKAKPQPSIEHSMNNGQKKKKGRPRGSAAYTKELGDAICDRIASGESLNKICKSAGYPTETTIRAWALNNEMADFASKYARAREFGWHMLGDGILELADDCSIDVNNRRLMVDTRKWFLSKVLPKIYGDRTEITGKDGGPIELKSDGTDLETARRVAFMLGRAIGKQSPPLLTSDIQSEGQQVQTIDITS